MNFSSDREEGRKGEAAVMAACVEMGYAPIECYQNEDPDRLVDVKYMRLSADDKVEFFCPDVKAISSFIPAERAMTCKNWGFGVEWISGDEGRPTPLSARNAFVSHLAFTSKSATGRRPFYLLNIEDVRAFFLAHKDDETLVKRMPRGKYWHMRKIDVPAFVNEFGFEYYYYNPAEQCWQFDVYGRQVRPDGVCNLLSKTPNWEKCDNALKWIVADRNKNARSILGDWEHVDELYNAFRQDNTDAKDVMPYIQKQPGMAFDLRFIPESEKKRLLGNGRTRSA